MAEMDTPKDTKDSLSTLNAYCLDNIFKHFSMNELLPFFGELNSIIDDSIERQMHRFIHTAFTMRYPPNLNEKQLQFLGQHIYTLDVSVGFSIKSEEVLKLLRPIFIGARQSGKFRALEIGHALFSRKYIDAVLPIAHLLLELKLGFCDIDDHAHLNHLLRSATRLEKLTIRNTQVNHLEHIVLSRVRHMTVKCVTDIMLGFDIEKLCKKYPDMTIVVFKEGRIRFFGPPIIHIYSYFMYPPTEEDNDTDCNNFEWLNLLA